MVLKKCRWCKKEFETEIPNKLYCNDEHRIEANKESSRKSTRKYYKNNKLSQILRVVGTTTISPHPKPDFEDEYIAIQKEIKKTFVSTSSKGRQHNNTWIDYEGQMEYGHIQPLGIQNTHNFANFDDYVNTSITYKLQNRPECPECGCTIHIKNIKHVNIACSECGLVLEGGEGLMATTKQDKINATNMKDLQDIGWKQYWINVSVLENKFKRLLQ